MTKRLHLICEAHIDPIWQWDLTEGLAGALSTFYSAVKLSEEFDYIFCHNEAILYECIKENAPELFGKIKELVKCGKWNIMGGWYLQPDANIPQGESIVRQIRMGFDFFKENFGVTPTVAVNFDSFGHSVGLPQILKKCGQTGYIICRSGSDPYPAKTMLWESPDGSQIKVFVSPDGYGSLMGETADKIRRRIAERGIDDVDCVLWGVGNHGGGPSRKDLADIKKLAEEVDFEIIHSTPEKFFGEAFPTIVHNKSFRTVMPGCYTSVSEIKRFHAKLEDELYLTEKMCTAAELRGLCKYPDKALAEAAKDLMISEFHDILPGSSIKTGESNGINIICHGLEILEKEKTKALFAMASAEESAADGEYPLFVFNPHPYEWETEVVCEFMLAAQNRSETIESSIRLYDTCGNSVEYQLVKEESNLNLDWRKKIVFHAKLKPMALNRFSAYVDYVPIVEKETCTVPTEDIVRFGKNTKVTISCETGLLTSFVSGGREYIKPDSFRPYLYDDNADPWGMSAEQLKRMGENGRPFRCVGGETPFGKVDKVQIIEDGDILTSVEAFFEAENNFVRLQYDIYKTEPYIDVTADTFMSAPNRMLKLAVFTNAESGEYYGQGAYCTEPLYNDGRECAAQRFSAVKDGSMPESEWLAFFNAGTHGSSFEKGTLYLSLLRTAVYCAHPIGERPLLKDSRYVNRFDLGERRFGFRMCACNIGETERQASEFATLPLARNLFPFPDAHRKVRKLEIGIDCRDIVLTAMKKEHNGERYILRLFNNSPEPGNAVLSLCGAHINLGFGRYEVKTVIYDGASLCETSELII